MVLQATDYSIKGKELELTTDVGSNNNNRFTSHY